MSNREEIPDNAGRREEARWRSMLDRRDAEQGRLPFHIEPPLEGEIQNRVKEAAAQDIRACRYSRQQIADGLSRLVGREITVAQLNAITAKSHPHRLPAEWLPAWCRITGSTRILELLCAEAGMYLANDTDRDLAELARAELGKQKLTQRAAVLSSAMVIGG